MTEEPRVAVQIRNMMPMAARTDAGPPERFRQAPIGVWDTLLKGEEMKKTGEPIEFIVGGTMKEKTIQVKRKRLEITNKSYFGVGVVMNLLALVSLWCFREFIRFTIDHNMADASNIGFWIFFSLFGFVAYNFIMIWMSINIVERWENVKIRE